MRGRLRSLAGLAGLLSTAALAQSTKSERNGNTGAWDAGAVEMPDKQTGSPMTYLINGKQYIVVAVSGLDGAELLAYSLQ